MLQTSQYLDSAFAKLHKYATFSARNYTTRPEVLDNVSPILQKSLQLLKRNRSDLYEDALSVLSQTRSSAISNMFIEALTRGVDLSKGSGAGSGREGGTARPIELHAHDPIRYVGDILAWIHQAMAGEREFLESLFGMKDTGRFVGAPRPSIPSVEYDPSASLQMKSSDSQRSDDGNDEGRLRALLDKNLEACQRPLRLRIQQTIKSHSSISSITTYQIYQLLEFYKVLLRKVMGSSALLYKLLLELCSFAYQSFRRTLEEQGQSILQTTGAGSAQLNPGAELRVPNVIRDSLASLKEIMQVHRQSLLDPEDRARNEREGTTTEEEGDFENVLEIGIHPILELLEKMKSTLPKGTPPPEQGADQDGASTERLIFDLNCTGAILSTLEPFRAEFTQQRMEELEERSVAKQAALTEVHVRAMQAS